LIFVGKNRLIKRVTACPVNGSYKGVKTMFIITRILKDLILTAAQLPCRLDNLLVLPYNFWVITIIFVMGDNRGAISGRLALFRKAI